MVPCPVARRALMMGDQSLRGIVTSTASHATQGSTTMAMAKTSNYLALDLGAESGRGLLGRFDGERLDAGGGPPLPQRAGPDARHALLGLAPALRGDQDRPAEGGGRRRARRRRRRYLGRRLRPDRPRRHPAGQPGPLPRRADRRHARRGVSAASPASGSTRSPACSSCRSTRSISSWPWRGRTRRSWRCAETLLMMPDLFGWLLTGRRAGERTDASTTQLLDPRQRHLVRRALPRPGPAPRRSCPT